MAGFLTKPCGAVDKKSSGYLLFYVYICIFGVQPGSLLTTMSGGASPSQAGASSPSLLDSSAGMSPSQQGLPVGCPNSVLRIIIENMIYPITLDVLHQVHVYIDTCTGTCTFVKLYWDGAGTHFLFTYISGCSRLIHTCIVYMFSKCVCLLFSCTVFIVVLIHVKFSWKLAVCLECLHFDCYIVY